jgi:SAM-dependent methyltransferase
MAMRKSRTRLDLLGVVEGHYASEIVLGLVQSGVLQQLANESRVDNLARATRMDPTFLDQKLDFVACATDLIKHDGPGRYSVGNYPLAEISFQFQKFIGAYGKSVRYLGTSAFPPSEHAQVDEKALAAAFSAVHVVPSRLAQRLRGDGYRRIVDIGCGPASLLVEMALHDREFAGVGLDRSIAMCRLAKRRISQAGLSSRLRVERGDVRDIGRILDARARRHTDAIHGRSLLNAFFGHGANSASALLRRLRSAFPGRIAFFVDYYGELGWAATSRHPYRLSRIHDLAQLASGQGVPPTSCRQWRALYRAAGCRLISSEDINTEDIRWFIHEVRLAA